MKRALADVLWEAANERLSVDEWDTNGQSEYSCWAVESAMVLAPGRSNHQVNNFLCCLGCDISRVQEFGVERGVKRQGARYMWLLLAMHVAEDEGIEIEVGK